VYLERLAVPQPLVLVIRITVVVTVALAALTMTQVQAAAAEAALLDLVVWVGRVEQATLPAMLAAAAVAMAVLQLLV
jgi:hypothetical protein